MIDKTQAISKVKQYLEQRGRVYTHLVEDKVELLENEIISYGKLEGQTRTVWNVPYEVESYDIPDAFFIEIDATDATVLYTIGPNNYVEDREEEGFE